MVAMEASLTIFVWKIDFFIANIYKGKFLPDELSLTYDLRQDPLNLSFWSFLTFVHHGIEDVERHLLWSFYKQIQRKSWSNVPPKLLACIRFLCKVVHKTAVSESSIAFARLNLTFLPLGLSWWNFAHLFIMFVATKVASDFLIFVWGLSYGLPKSKKRGKIITKLWNIIIKAGPPLIWVFGHFWLFCTMV